MPSIAAVPTGSAVDPCCCEECSTSETLDAVVSGFSDCGCFETGGGKARIVAHTGITGGQTVTLVAPGTWVGLIGTVTLERYSDGLCEVFDSSEDFDVTLQVTCAGPPAQYQAKIIIGSGVVDWQTIFLSAPGDLDEALTNTRTCGIPSAALVDTVTVSLP